MSDSDAYEKKVHTRDLSEAHVRHDALSDSDARNMIRLQSIETRGSPMTPGVVVAREGGAPEFETSITTPDVVLARASV